MEINIIFPSNSINLYCINLYYYNKDGFVSKISRCKGERGTERNRFCFLSRNEPKVVRKSRMARSLKRNFAYDARPFPSNRSLRVDAKTTRLKSKRVYIVAPRAISRLFRNERRFVVHSSSLPPPPSFPLAPPSPPLSLSIA